MKSTTILIFLISSVVLTSANYVPKWSTSCLLAANISANIWQPTSITVSPTPSPSSTLHRLIVCGDVNEDFIADHWNITSFAIGSGPITCIRGAPVWRTNQVWLQRNATAGSEYCLEIFTAKAKVNSGIYMSFLNTMVLSDSQNRNLGCFTLFDTLDENLEKECNGPIYI